MKKGIIFLSLAIMLTSCSSDSWVGQRYRAERELFRADWQFDNLKIRPQDVSDDQWAAMVQIYESISTRYLDDSELTSQTGAEADVRAIAARALFRAARIYAIQRDSIGMDQIYTRIAENFSDVDQVAAEVAMAQGSVAESRGELEAAVGFYSRVVSRVAPEPGGAGVAGVVLDLPLKIARLIAIGKPTADPAEGYDPAKAYYKRMIENRHSDMIEVESRFKLAMIEAEMGNWDQAIEELRALETQLNQMPEPMRHPSEVRFSIAGIQKRAGMSLPTIHGTLSSILEEYPGCEKIPLVLTAMAENANQRGEVDEALGYLSQIADDYKDNADVAPMAILARARTLVENDRWPEALEDYRSLPILYPITSAALWVPLDIAKYYHDQEAWDQKATALEQAVEEYTSFITRYPDGGTLNLARERLAQTYALQENYTASINELILLGDELAGTRKGVMLHWGAVRSAMIDLADTTRGIEILEHIGAQYQDTNIGRQAVKEAERLRGIVSR